MRGMFSLVGLVVVMAVVALLVKKQWSSIPVPVQAAPGAPAAQDGTAPAGNVREQGRQLQDHVRQQVEGALQQARPVHEGDK